MIKIIRLDIPSRANEKVLKLRGDMNDNAKALPEADESENDDLETMQLKIAEQLSELSSAENAPVGFKVSADPFDPSEVSFTSSGWLLRIVQVQVWLNPDSEIDRKKVEKEPAVCAEALFKAIGAE